MKKKFKIAVSWEMCGTVDIDEALKRAEETQDSMTLPTENDYIDGSFIIDHESSKAIADIKKGLDNLKDSVLNLDIEI